MFHHSCYGFSGLSGSVNRISDRFLFVQGDAEKKKEKKEKKKEKKDKKAKKAEKAKEVCANDLATRQRAHCSLGCIGCSRGCVGCSRA